MIDTELVNYISGLVRSLLTDDNRRPLPKENWLAVIELITADMEDYFWQKK